MKRFSEAIVSFRNSAACGLATMAIIIIAIIITAG